MDKSPYEEGLKLWLSKLQKKVHTKVAIIERIESCYNQEKNFISVRARLKDNSVDYVPNGLRMVLSSNGGNLHEAVKKKTHTKIIAIVEKSEIKKSKLQITLLIEINSRVDELKKHVNRSSFLHFVPEPQMDSLFFISNHRRFVNSDIAFQWSLVHSLMPLRKLCDKSESNSKSSHDDFNTKNKNMICLQSMSDSKSPYAKGQLCRFLKNIRYTLSHSAEISKLEKLCEATIEEVIISDKSISIIVSLDQAQDFWENTDIFLHPTGLYSEEQCFVSTQSSSESKVTAESITRENLSEHATVPEVSVGDTVYPIGGWKYLDGHFERHRAHVQGDWKNTYLAEIRLQPISESEIDRMKTVEIGAELCLSLNSDIPGPVFLKVVEIDDETHVLTVNVIGFESPEVKLELSKELTYFLDNYVDDDQNSFASESETLDGYQLMESMEEICEEIGDLTLCEATVKSYLDPNTDSVSVHARLAFTSENNEMKSYRLLEGAHVLLYSKERANCVLTVVSRLLADIMILSVVGKVSDFEVTRHDIYYIRPATEFMAFLRSFREQSSIIYRSEKLRDDILYNDSDLRFIRFYIDAPLRKRYCQFAVKSDVFEKVENGTVFLMSKLYEVEDTVTKNTDFAFGIKRKSPEECSPDEPTTVWFEILRSRKKLDRKSAEDMYFSKVLYYIEPEKRDFLDLQTEWKRFDVLVKADSRYLMASRFVDMQVSIPFKINTYWKPETTTVKPDVKIIKLKSIFDPIVINKDEPPMDPRASSPDGSVLLYVSTTSQSDVSSTENAEIMFDSKFEKDNSSTDTTMNQQLFACEDEFNECGFVNITDYLTENENDCDYLYLILEVNEETTKDEQDDPEWSSPPISMESFQKGERIYLGLDHTNPSIFIIGDVVDTLANKVKLVVDQKCSNMEFVEYWIEYMLSFKMKSMMMLCYKQKENMVEKLSTF